MTRKDSIVFVFLYLFLAAGLAWAQAPAAVPGKAFFLTVGGGKSPFAGAGASLFLPASAGPGYTLTDITNIASSTGNYSYTVSNADGLITATDSVAGIFTGDFSFSSAASGTYTFNQAVGGGYQNGNFNLYTGQAPVSLAGKTLYLTTQGGTTNSGTAIAAFTATSVTLTTGGTSISVPYTYSILNTSAGKITASALGTTVTAFFAFSDPANGGFAVQDSSGYEYGTFNIPDHVLPTEQITAPTAGLLVSNANYTVTGTAMDNVAVSNVWYSFNNGAWTNASTGNVWTNWNATVTLLPGTNTIVSYSVDTSGNVSATNTVRFVYVVTTALAVSTNDLGTLNQNYNGALLQVGRNYTITATAGTGFAFTNWFGGTTLPLNWLTNGSTVQFTMVSNLMLQANFVDVTKPTLSITNVTSGMTVSNPSFTVTGTARDNVAVANVWYSLNNDIWTNAESANGWSNWNATVDLLPGTNTIAAYSVDTTGNISATNTVKLVYVVSAMLTVSTNGLGSLNQNYNGALLQVGRNYAITATAGTGFAFTNWFGGTTLPLNWLTNGATVQFTMVSNLTLQANFVDVTKPTLSITNITSGMTVSNQSFTVRGTARDNVAVANVWYSFNSGIWTNAESANGWSNWNATVDLLPGTNTIAAYSVDTTGNISATNTVKLVYIVSAMLTVSTNGLGTLNQNYNGALLQIGRNYTITATAGTGFAFTNWFGGTTLPLNWLTNGATVQFTMVSNLMLQANFVDVTRPTLSITNITSGMTVSNPSFTVRGTAGDNVAVANVFYSLNNSDWNGANPGNSWSNWNSVVTLLPGTNTIAAYSVDTTGNISITNTVKLVYIVSAMLTVSTNGLGTLNQNYNGALLQVGRNYTITATAGTGFAFTNWFGGTTLPLNWLTNGTTVQFTMVSNLTLQANFVDVTKPTLSITNITSGMTVSNQSFTVRGTARDNVAVANVWYSFNSGIWTNAESANGWSNWNATVDLLPGTNTIAAYSVDTTGNISTTNTVKLVYIVSAVLTISTNGLGTLSPNDSGALLQIGRNYNITATPASGFIFTNWTGGTGLPLVWLTNGPTVQFTMVTNLMLQANFVDVARPTLTITTPTPGQHVTNAVTTVRGTATDNWEVTGVWYQLNGGAWNQPQTANSWTNWAATVQLQASTNTFRAYAVDPGGNYSITNSVSFVSSNAFKLQLGFSSSQPMTAKGLNVNLQLSTGLNGHIEVSTDLMNWTVLTNFTGTNANIDFYDCGATNLVPHFYRAVIP